MKKIIIEQLELTNFKGLKSLRINFNPNLTNISGDNATGKTTIFDAFTWLLYGKDSTGRSDFSIKTLDKYNKVIHKLDHGVKGLFNVDGAIVVLERILREKWTKPRGQVELELTGNETVYFVNEVPMSEKDFKAKISEIIEENTFKMLTSPFAFQNLKWQERREILIKIAGGVNETDIIGANKDYQDLYDTVKRQSTSITFDFQKEVDDYRKSIAQKKKNIKEGLSLIPSRIDEVQKTIPTTEPNYAEIATKIGINNVEISEFEDQIADKSKVTEQALKAKNDRQKQVYDLKSQLQKIEFDEQDKISKQAKGNADAIGELKYKLKTIERDIDSANLQLSYKKKEFENNSGSLKLLSTSFTEISAKEIVFNDAEFTCPTCEREFDADNIDKKKTEFTGNFNLNKIKELERVNESGVALKGKNLLLEKEMATITEQLRVAIKNETDCKSEIKKMEQKAETEQPLPLEQRLLKVPAWIEIKDKITAIESIADEINPVDVSELRNNINTLRHEIDQMKQQLNVKDQVETSRKRVAELEKQMKTQGQALADLERQDFVIANFIKDKITSLETKINGLFKFVRFRMFETLVNGNESECCLTLGNSNGSFVPFEDLNNACKINSGLDIINTLSQVKNVTAPLFCDNAEASNYLIETQAQVIRLVVTHDKELTF